MGVAVSPLGIQLGSQTRTIPRCGPVWATWPICSSDWVFGRDPLCSGSRVRKDSRANIYDRVSLPGKPGFRAFLTFESEAVRTKPYPHDYSSKPIREAVVQRVCQFASGHGTGKSLKVKEEEENASDTRFERPFGRDDLDISVKPSA